MQIQTGSHTCNNLANSVLIQIPPTQLMYAKYPCFPLVDSVCKCCIKQQVSSRIQVFVLPNPRGQLPDNPRIQNQVVDEALVTWGTKQVCYLTCVSAAEADTMSCCSHTHTRQILGKYQAWGRGSSARTACCCQKDADVCSILCRNRPELILANTESVTKRKRKERRGGHLGARNTWPADSKELGSKDCISVIQIQKVIFFVLHLHETECERLSLAVLTLELHHHITQVCLDVEFIVRR